MVGRFLYRASNGDRPPRLGILRSHALLRGLHRGTGVRAGRGADHRAGDPRVCPPLRPAAVQCATGSLTSALHTHVDGEVEFIPVVPNPASVTSLYPPNFIAISALRVRSAMTHK